MLDTHARRFVQPLIGRTADRLSRAGLSPTQVTWIAFALGLGSAAFVAFGQPWLGAVLLWISGYLDAVDGSMARALKRSTAWGTLLDITFDRIVEVSIIIALALRVPQARVLLVLLTAAIVFSITVFLTVGALSEKRGEKSFYYQAGLAERSEGFILFTLMILWQHWLIWSTALFLVVETFTGVQRLLEARRLLR